MNRVYKIGESMVEIPRNAIEKFIEWSFAPFNAMVCYDEKMAHALFVVCAGVNKISEGIVEDETKMFIKGKFLNGFLFKWLHLDYANVLQFQILFLFISFILELLNVRTGGNASRLNKMDLYIERLFEKANNP